LIGKQVNFICNITTIIKKIIVLFFVNLYNTFHIYTNHLYNEFLSNIAEDFLNDNENNTNIITITNKITNTNTNTNTNILSKSTYNKSLTLLIFDLNNPKLNSAKEDKIKKLNFFNEKRQSFLGKTNDNWLNKNIITIKKKSHVNNKINLKDLFLKLKNSKDVVNENEPFNTAVGTKLMREILKITNDKVKIEKE